MALDFPASPTDGMVYQNYVWSSTDGVWRASNSAQTFPVQISNGGTGATTVDAAQDTLGIGMVRMVPPTVNFSGGAATVNSLGIISFTSVTSISLNNVFSSNYNSYRILVGGGLIASTTYPILGMRMRNAGTDRTSGYQTYGFSFYGVTYSNIGVATSYAHIGPMTNFTINAADITILNPALNKDTVWFSSSFGANGSGNGYTSTGGYDNGGSLTFDGFTLLPTSGNMTGNVQVLAYNS